MPRGKAARVELSKDEREALERNVRRRKSAHALAQRSRIILLASEGLIDGAIAARVGLCRETVGIWRNRFVKDRLEGLLDEPRVGRPREIGDEQVEAVVVTTLESKPEAATQWRTGRRGDFVSRGRHGVPGKIVVPNGCSHEARGAAAASPGFTTSQGRPGCDLRRTGTANGTCAPTDSSWTPPARSSQIRTRLP